MKLRIPFCTVLSWMKIAGILIGKRIEIRGIYQLKTRRKTLLFIIWKKGKSLP